MAHTRAWDETTPSNTTDIVDIDDAIVAVRLDTRERLAVDHKFESSDDADDSYGRHKQVTFDDNLAIDPSVSGDVSCLYPKKLSGDSAVVPFFRNAISGVTRLMLGDGDTIAWFYVNVAPPGWLAYGDVTDAVLAVAGGEDDYNVDGGNAVGAWEISGLTNAEADNHTHTLSSHTHTLATDSTAPGADMYGRKIVTDGTYLSEYTFDGNAATGIPKIVTGGPSEASSGASGSHGHAISHDAGWRPSAAVGKLYQLDVTV